MNELTDICTGDVQGATLTRLRASCQNAGQAFGVSTGEIVLIVVFMLIGAGLLLAYRRREGADGGTLAGNMIEGALYAAIGAFAGSSVGLLAAEIVPPRVFGTVIALVCVVAVIFASIGVLAPDADGDARGMGFVLALLLGVVGIVIAAYAWAVPTDGDATGPYRAYLTVAAIGLGITGAADGLAAALSRGPHWAAGWALVFLNSSWGFLGNILGLGARIGSSFGYASDGSVVNPNRKWYTLYRRGMTMKRVGTQRFAFTQGWVIACDQPGEIQGHECWHVAQNFILGPIYVISHGVWDALGAGIGLVAGISGSVPGAGILERWNYSVTAWSYYNNPYEIWAYSTHAHGARQDADKLIIPSPWSKIFAAIWIIAFAAGLTALALHWTN